MGAGGHGSRGAWEQGVMGAALGGRQTSQIIVVARLKPKTARSGPIP